MIRITLQKYLSEVLLIIQLTRDDIRNINDYWIYIYLKMFIPYQNQLQMNLFGEVKKMKDLGHTHFCYYEDWLKISNKNKKSLLIRDEKIWFRLLLIQPSTIRKIKYEYVRYFKTRFRFYFPQIYSFFRFTKQIFN